MDLSRFLRKPLLLRFVWVRNKTQNSTFSFEAELVRLYYDDCCQPVVKSTRVGSIDDFFDGLLSDNRHYTYYARFVQGG